MLAHAPINNIIPFSLVDGPGARCSIFLQGCNLRCAYCHNPETQRLCVNCGACVQGCPAGALFWDDGRVSWDAGACVRCDTCIGICTWHASPRVRWRSAAEIFERARDCMPFIRGITVSGGECMLYPEFLAELFELCQGVGLGRLIDSNGTVSFEEHERLLALADGVMLDVKCWDDTWFERLTGQNGITVRKNLAYLAGVGKLAELRVIITEGFNDPEATVDGIARILGSHTNTTRLRLMRFRPFGVRGEMAGAAAPPNARVEALEHQARKLGFGEVVTS